MTDNPFQRRHDAKIEANRRRFAYPPRRTVTADGITVLDALDTDGRAWWLVVGHDETPDYWTELQPLPPYEAQP